VQEIF